MTSQIERFGPTRRGGPLFRWLGEPLAIDLANTVMVVREGAWVDLVAEPEDLQRWLDAERDRLGEHRADPECLADIRPLRDAARALLIGSVKGLPPNPEGVEVVNTACARAPVTPRLVATDRDGLRAVETTGTDDPWAELVAKLARSVIELLTGPEAQQLRVCHAPSCGMLFLGARRWCCAACGNRARAARHYRRSRSAGAAGRR